MKNKPFYIQLTVLFSTLVLIVSLLFLTVIPATLKSFFTDEIYQTIEEAQLNYDSSTTNRSGHMGHGMMGGMGGMHMMQQNVRSAEHLYINREGDVIEGGSFSVNLLHQFYDQALSQKSESSRYEIDINDRVMFYVIKKHPTERSEIFQISYMWDTYQKELSATLLKKIVLILVGVLLASIGLAMIFAKRIVKPIEYMKEAVAKITKKNWNEKVTLNRTDELGELANSIDYMRLQLKHQDESEKSLLQQISHDLKTPVMVIRSYTEALKDGVYPNGTLEGSADVIDKEAKNLEKKIKDLLLLTKLDYLADTKLTIEEVNMGELIDSVISRLHPYRPEVTVIKDIENISLNGNKEQLTILLENLIDNALKYSEKEIEIKSFLEGNNYVIECSNDGKLIEEEVVEKAFHPFVKGKQGNFGLGLTIMKRIALLHNGSIKLEIKNDKTIVEIKIMTNLTEQA